MVTKRRKKKPKSVLKSITALKKVHARERKELRVKHKKQLERHRLALKAEAHYHKTGHWPRWWTKKKS